MSDECQGCKAAAAKPDTGLYVMHCESCRARLLSNSPGFNRSMIARKMDAQYLAELKSIFGSRWETGHRMAKDWAQRIDDYRSGQPIQEALL